MKQKIKQKRKGERESERDKAPFDPQKYVYCNSNNNLLLRFE